VSKYRIAFLAPIVGFNANILRKSLMQITNNLHAFIWQSMTANNCNAYFIDGPTRIMIDPGHRALFDHVDLGLKELGLKTDDIDLVICTHAHPDHLEAVPLFKQKAALFTLHETEWHFFWNRHRYLFT
jgi:glyoxylase-like metal-dependent hydrolase (beta-lactamase superfamily II)